MPQVHMAERRRLFEGRRVLNELEAERRERNRPGLGDPTRPERRSRKQGRKQRAAAYFAEQRGLV